MKNICKYDTQINEILGIDIPADTNVCCSPGLETHLIKRNHTDVVELVPQLKELITTSDYVGQSSRHGNASFEMVKILQDNVLVAVKFDVKNENLYVASMYKISDTKLQNRIKSGRLKLYARTLDKNE